MLCCYCRGQSCCLVTAHWNSIVRFTDEREICRSLAELTFKVLLTFKTPGGQRVGGGGGGRNNSKMLISRALWHTCMIMTVPSSCKVGTPLQGG